MTLKKRLFFRVSHALATLAPNFFGVTKPYHEIVPPFPLPGQGRVFLGAMLLDAPTGIYHRYDYKTVCEQLAIGVVVRTLEAFERTIPLWGGVKAASKAQYQALGVAVVDIEIKDFIADFKQAPPTFVAELFSTMQALIAHQAAGKSIYFHCKAGKNRSFKALTTYLVYVQTQKAIQENTLTDETLSAVIRRTCALIKAHRPQIIYRNARQMAAHEAFVFACIKAFLGPV